MKKLIHAVCKSIMETCAVVASGLSSQKFSA